MSDCRKATRTEEQAADYPAGAHEFALQRAAEAGDQKDLDAVFSRRDGRQTLELALIVLALVSPLVLASRWLDFGPARRSRRCRKKSRPAAGIVAVGDPWTALGMLVYGICVAQQRSNHEQVTMNRCSSFRRSVPSCRGTVPGAVPRCRALLAALLDPNHFSFLPRRWRRTIRASSN